MEVKALHLPMRKALANVLLYSHRCRLLATWQPQHVLSLLGRKEYHQLPLGAEYSPQCVSRICCTSMRKRLPIKPLDSVACGIIVRGKLSSVIKGHIDRFYCVQMDTRTYHHACINLQDSLCVEIEKQLPSHHVDTIFPFSTYRRKFSSKYGDEKPTLSEVLADIASIAQDVIASVSLVDKMVLSIPQQKVENVVNMLLEEGMTSEQVKELLHHKPSLLKHNKLKEVFSLLRSYDLASSDMFEVLMGVHNLTHLRDTKIEAVFDILRVAGLKDGKLQQLVVSEPGILDLTDKSIQDRVLKLKMLFKTEDVLWVIVKTPAVLICDWGELEEKFQYVSGKMKVSQRQMMYSHLFSYTLDHVKCRHQFLVRAGLFSMDQHAKSSNPRLQDIIDTSDADFVKRFGGMHVDEYTTFCKLMAKTNIIVEE